MLVLTRRPGECVVIDGRTVVTVAVVAREFIDLCVTDISKRARRVCTLSPGTLVEIANGVSATIAHVDPSLAKARIAFDFPRDVVLVRGEFFGDPEADQP
ncbi:MAG TPA: hypothetical protein VML55_07710 [Planctomycetaceae bacterium]|nr:hypothetical protein [Planctomycetaceae bacterium]